MTTLLEIEPVAHHLGWQRRKLFPNGWGVSVIPEHGHEDLCEIAVLSHEGGKQARITSESGLFGSEDSVSRYLTFDQADYFVGVIETLPPYTPKH
jgi:hypothetical protein